MDINLRCDLNIEDTFFFINSRRIKNKCIHCESYNWTREIPVIMKASVDDILMSGFSTGEYLSATYELGFIIFSQGLFFSLDRIFLTYKEAEKSINDDYYYFNFENPNPFTVA